MTGVGPRLVAAAASPGIMGNSYTEMMPRMWVVELHTHAVQGRSAERATRIKPFAPLSERTSGSMDCGAPDDIDHIS